MKKHGFKCILNKLLNKYEGLNISTECCHLSEECGVAGLTLVVSAEEVAHCFVMMAPGPVREERFLRSVPALSSRLVTVDSAGLLGFVEVVFSRGPHHIAPLHILHLPAELLADLGGDVHPGLPAGATGPGEVELERVR